MCIVFIKVCLSVYLSVCEKFYSKTTKRICMQFSVWLWYAIRKKRLTFVGELDLDSDFGSGSGWTLCLWPALLKKLLDRFARNLVCSFSMMYTHKKKFLVMIEERIRILQPDFGFRARQMAEVCISNECCFLFFSFLIFFFFSWPWFCTALREMFWTGAMQKKKKKTNPNPPKYIIINVK